MRAPLPVTLISGYLGAGKTTLVNHLLRNAGGKRLLVMVNDFGELPIDADLIEAEDGDTLTLANGCICCSMNGDLAGAFMDVLDRDPWPDHLVIEASGVAEPHRIANLAMAEPDLSLSGVVVVSDATTIRSLAAEPMIGPTIQRQLGDADLHLLNKTDLLDGEDEGGAAAWLSESFPGRVVTCAEAHVPVELVLGEFEGNSSQPAQEEHDHEDVYMRWSLETGAAFDEHKLRKALACLPAGVLRLKGMVLSGAGRGLVVQCVGARVSVSEAEVPEASRLVAIGLKRDVSADQLDALIASCCEH